MRKAHVFITYLQDMVNMNDYTIKSIYAKTSGSYGELIALNCGAQIFTGFDNLRKYVNDLLKANNFYVAEEKNCGAIMQDVIYINCKTGQADRWNKPV